MDKSIIVAIDGPAGSGKSTITKIVAEKLKLLYIDTGAMYRAITLAVIQHNLKTSDTVSVIKLAKNSTIGLKRIKGGSLQVILNNKDVTEDIRTQDVNARVSDIAKIGEIRKIMVSQQRQLGKNGGVVLEGRDIGTVVFPDAKFKFFLDATVSERAKRRFLEVKDKYNVTYEEIEQSVKNRDKIDSERDIGPLKKADDAISIDTTNMKIEEVVNTILNYISK